MIRASGNSERIAIIVSTPLMSGRRRSISVTSGRCVRNCSMPSWPVAAWAITVHVRLLADDRDEPRAHERMIVDGEDADGARPFTVMTSVSLSGANATDAGSRSSTSVPDAARLDSRELAADALRALAHAGQAPMPIAPGVQDLLVDPAAIVADQHAQVPRTVFELDFDSVRARVTERVDQRLASDAIDLIADQRMNRADASFDGHLEIRAVARGVFLLHQHEGLLQVVAALGAQSADRDAAFVADAAHQREHALELLPVRRLGGQIVDGGMQLHRGAHHALQQRVVQLLRDARAFGQAFFETDVQLPRELPRAQLVGGEHERAAGGDDEEAEPGGLPEGGFHHERDRRVGLAPSSIARAAHHAEGVRAGREMRVDRLGGGGRPRSSRDRSRRADSGAAPAAETTG